MKNSPDSNGIPNMQMPAAFRDMTEKSLVTCRDSFEQLKENADRTNAALGKPSSTWARASPIAT